MKEWTPERKAKIKAFIDKAEAEKRLPESYFAHLKYEIEMIAYGAFASLQAEFASINPVVQIQYFLNREIPKLSPNKDMRKCASNALLEASLLGDVKHGEGLLTELGANVNYMNGDGETALYNAVRRKRLGMAEMLLKRGAENKAGGDCLTPFNHACAAGFIPGIHLMLKYGADVNQSQKVKDWHRFYLGYSTFNVYPLAIAISQNQAKACQTLLDNGARLDLKIKPELTVQEFADNNFDDMSDEMKALFAPILGRPQPVTAQRKPVPVSALEHTRS